jgi:hypothetical protein
VFGYLNASWTLRADNNAHYICRVLDTMQRKGAEVVVPSLPDDHGMAEDDIIVFSSGYLQRARAMMPKSAATLPWRLNQDYLADCRDFRKRPVDDGVLQFASFETLDISTSSGPRSSGQTDEEVFPNSVRPEEGSKLQAESPSRRTGTDAA